MTHLKIKTLTVSHFQQNTRILFNENDRLILIIDPGFDEDRIIKESCLDEYTLHGIILTHTHLDHAGAVQPLLDKLSTQYALSPPLYYHSKELPIATQIEALASLYELPGLYHNVPPATHSLDDLSSIQFGDLSFTVLFTPGHSPGHIVLFTTPETTTLEGEFSESTSPNQPILIAGDTLFQNSIGRTDLPLANSDQLIESIKTQLLPLPSTTLVLPGHGPNTTIGHEKQSNPFFKRKLRQSHLTPSTVLTTIKLFMRP
jgi:hydroxyacylglutathione hydrolase